MNKMLQLDTEPQRVERLELSDEPIKRDGLRGHGGEGKVYETTDRRGCVAKIYVKTDDVTRRKKIEAMLHSKPKNADAQPERHGHSAAGLADPHSFGRRQAFCGLSDATGAV